MTQLDPVTPPARLQELAIEFPHLQADIARHPNVYPGLLDWIAVYGTPEGQAAVQALRASSGAGVHPQPAAPAQPVAQPTGEIPGAAPQRPVAPRRRIGLATLAVIIGGAVVLGGAGVAAAIVLPRVLPAASPVAAAERVVGAATSLDLLGLATVLAPSEAALYTASIENSSSVAFEGLDGEMRSIEASLRQLQASLVFTAEDVEWEEETLVKDEVVRVTMTEGILTLDSSDDEAVATALATFAEPQLRIQYAAWGYSDREIEERVEDLVDEIEDSLDFPIEIDAEELLDDSDDLWGIRAVVVREGAGWYVSPLLTVADMQALPMLSWRSDVEIGDEIPVAAVTSSPEEAVTATLNAAFDARAGRRYWSDLAATLPLAERRLVALYGPALIHERSPFANAPRGYAIELERAEFGEVRIDGGRAFLGDADVRIDVYDGYSEYEFAIDGTCFAMTSEYSGRQEPACLEDLERVWPFDLDEIGLDDPMLVAVKESGGWQFSPVATVAHLQAKMSEAIVALSNEGKLDRLFN